MSNEEIDIKIKELLGDSPERAIIAECIYKGQDYRSFSITVSDSKEDGFEIPYAPFTAEDENEDLITLLERRRGDEYSENVRNLLLVLKDSLNRLSLDFKDEDIEALVTLEKPVIMVSRRKA